MITAGTPRAVADMTNGVAIATVEVAADPDRVFRALASVEVTRWWVRPGVFDTREWAGDVKPGGRWRASGIFRGNPYTLEGAFVEVNRPRKLVHTWRAPGNESTVTYELEPIDGGTRITLRHSDLHDRQACSGNAIGWETSFEALQRLLG